LRFRNVFPYRGLGILLKDAFDYNDDESTSEQ